MMSSDDIQPHYHLCEISEGEPVRQIYCDSRYNGPGVRHIPCERDKGYCACKSFRDPNRPIPGLFRGTGFGSKQKIKIGENPSRVLPVYFYASKYLAINKTVTNNRHRFAHLLKFPGDSI